MSSWFLLKLKSCPFNSLILCPSRNFIFYGSIRFSQSLHFFINFFPNSWYSQKYSRSYLKYNIFTSYKNYTKEPCNAEASAKYTWDAIDNGKIISAS